MTREERKAALIKEMIAILSHDDIEASTKRYYLKNIAIQKWTDDIRNGKKTKHLGCIYWSDNAVAKYLKNKELIKEKAEGAPPKCETGLIHEHVIPKNWLISRLFLDVTVGQSLKTAQNDIDFYLEDMTYACIVTKEEHNLIDKYYRSEMPKEAFEITGHPDYNKYWLRYKKANLKVYRLKWNEENTKAIIEGEIDTDMKDWTDTLIPIDDLDKKYIDFK